MTEQPRLQSIWLHWRRRRRGSSGQAMPLLVGGIVAVLAVAGLVIDGGNVFAQQRIVQNGADAAAKAGAEVMAERLAAPGSMAAGDWDAAVFAHVHSMAAANDLADWTAYYTDICGIPLTSTGTPALNGDRTMDLTVAARVGSGIPTSIATNPDCPNLQVGPPAGVLVVAQKTVASYVSGVVGINSFTAAVQATAVSGYLTGFCDASEGQACALLPIAIPVNIVTCSGSNNLLNSGVGWSTNVVYKIPLCGNSPGNVGWLDWTPTAGGTSELIDSILHPNNPPIDLPTWQYVTSTGNVNSQTVENAVNTYDGQIVLIPQFDITCSSEPGSSSANFGCPSGDVGGNGQNQWYHMPSFAALRLCDPSISACGNNRGAYINGNNQAVCDTGNGATSCLVGAFVNFVTSGPVSAIPAGGTSSKIVGVQLVR
jgi:hypothetical protein